MKKLIGLIVAVFSICMVVAGCAGTPSESIKETAVQDNSFPATEQTTEPEGGESAPPSEADMLIVYFSYTNNTERVAKLLHQKINADIYEIEVMEPYSEGTQSIDERVKEEKKSGSLPQLKGYLPDLATYDFVLIGGPVWSYTISTPLMSYLEQTDLGGKTVMPFWTDAGSPGDYEKDFTEQVKNGQVTEGLQLSHISSMDDSEINERLDDWLSKVNMTD